jgi:RimJ/RimL family protein N-acetyltransferase
MDKTIDTGRLILRRFTLDDLPAFYQLCSRPETIRYAQSTPLASLDERADMGLARLVALVHPDNVASANVLTRLGFAVEKQLRYSGLQDFDVNLFSMDLRRATPGVPR